MSDHIPATEAIRARLPDFKPRLGVILGSGLGGVADGVEDATIIPYGDLPGYPLPGVEGHAGNLVCGRIGDTPVMVFQGRKHFYEGEGFDALKVMVRSVMALGGDTLLVTCAAGSINPDVMPGRVLAIADHINMMGSNPLIGPNDDSIGPRFPGLENAWDEDLRAALHSHADDLDIDLAEGVHAAVSGPAFETPAEVRAIKIWGADTVGMSTVPECLIARHCGLKVAGLAAITNLAVGLTDEAMSHDHTLEGAALAGPSLQRLVLSFAAGMSDD
ncbi:MAG: purine-nucleoside phosphorylase [Alphaproteobacteria bacterium]